MVVVLMLDGWEILILGGGFHLLRLLWLRQVSVMGRRGLLEVCLVIGGEEVNWCDA